MAARVVLFVAGAALLIGGMVVVGRGLVEDHRHEEAMRQALVVEAVTKMYQDRLESAKAGSRAMKAFERLGREDTPESVFFLRRKGVAYEFGESNDMDARELVPPKRVGALEPLRHPSTLPTDLLDRWPADSR